MRQHSSTLERKWNRQLTNDQTLFSGRYKNVVWDETRFISWWLRDLLPQYLPLVLVVRLYRIYNCSLYRQALIVATHGAKSCWRQKTTRSEANLSVALFQPYFFCLLSFRCLTHVLTICTSFPSALRSLLISSSFSCSCCWNSAFLAFICSCNNKG